MNQKRILSLIDSFAVEVPEAQPGAIDNAIGWLEEQWENSGKKELLHSRRRVIAAARAELAQLQADRDRSVADNIKLRTEIVGSDKRDIAIRISNQETEIENLKGALRTLAREMGLPKCYACPILAEECKNRTDCKEALIAYALAHPTEAET